MIVVEYIDSNVKGAPLEYIGQTGRSFGTRYKEHVSAIEHNKDTSTYA
jgi:hypothetical protein